MAGTTGASTTNFLRTTLTKEQIGTITFENNNIVPDGENIVSVPVAKTENDKSIMLWYEIPDNEEELYDIHIGSDNGRVSIDSGSSLFQNLSNLQ